MRIKSIAVSPARLAAFNILRRVEEEGAYASVLLALQADSLTPRDRALCRELTIGGLRWQLWLDHLIAHYANRAPDRLDLPVRIALRLGLYQLRFLSRVRPSAAVNESVNLVAIARHRSAEGFVNAVLRKASRDPGYDPAASTSNPIERLAIQTSHPCWLVERWIEAFGMMDATALAQANNEAAPVAFRIVRAAADQDEVLTRLRAEGASLFPSLIAKGAWRITGAAGLLHDLAKAGQIYIQDEASQFVAEVVDVASGESVLDLCAAPGGKTTHIAARGGSQALVVACDFHLHRLRTVVESARRQHLEGIRFVVLDGLQELPFGEAGFDWVLVDAPCSGTGTLRHNPDIRWRISAADIRDLSTRQQQLLLNAARLVKPGGRLVYSTCSVEPEENEEVAAAFLQNEDSFTQVSLAADPGLGASSGAIRTWPHRQGTDGFFVAAFERKR